MILSLDKQTKTVAAPWRNGPACLALEVRLHRARRPLAYGGRVAGLNRACTFAGAVSFFDFGGLIGLKQAGSRMFAAPSPLDSSAMPEEGDP